METVNKGPITPPGVFPDTAAPEQSKKGAFIGSLRVRLILLVLLAMLPVLAVMLISTAQQMKQRQAQVKENLLRLSRLVAANQEQYYEGARQMLISLSRSPLVRDANAVECSQFLSNLLPQYPGYGLLAVADTKGNIFCSSTPLTAPVNVSDRSYFQQALNINRFGVGDYHIGRLTNLPSLGMAFPVQSQLGRVKSVVFLTINLDSLDGLSQKVGLASYRHTYITLVDSKGTILTHLPDGASLQGASLKKDSIFSAISSGSEGSFEGTCIGGSETCLFAFSRLNPSPSAGYIVVSSLKREAFAALYANALYELAGLALVFLVATGAAWIGGDYFLIRTIRKLANATKRIEQGDLSARTEVRDGPGELSQLAKSFDQMAESLEQRERKLRQAEAARHSSELRLANIFQNTSEAIVTVDEELQIIIFNKGAEQIFGYTSQEIIGQPLTCLLPPICSDSHDRFIQSLKRMAGLSPDTHPHRHQLFWARKDASTFPAEVSASWMKDGSRLIYTIFLADITLREQAIEGMQESKRTIAALLSNLPGMAYRARKDADEWKFEFTSEGTFDLTGYPPEAFSVSPTLSYDSIIHPEDVDRVNSEIETANRAGQPFRMVYRIRHASGEDRWVWEQGRLTLRGSSQEPVMEGFITDITERRKAEEKIEHQFHRMAALRVIDIAITGLLDLPLILSTLVEQVSAQLQVDAAVILLYNAGRFEYATGTGFRGQAIQHLQIQLGEGIVGQAGLERRMVFCPDDDHPQECTVNEHLPALAVEEFSMFCAIPLIAKSELKGMLIVFHRSPLQVDWDWIDFLEALADQAAIAIETATLYEDSKRSNLELTLAYEETIEGWAAALELRHQETEGHSRRVVEKTVELARLMGIPDEDLVHIRRGAILHDIGKMGIPDNILLKPGPLTEQEWEIMRKHPNYAYQLISTIPFLRSALDIPYAHHERWNGGGYPRGLKGREIPLAARIFAVIDVWDALRSDRPYRRALLEEEVHHYLIEQAGIEFDPQVVEKFIALLTKAN